MSFVQRELARIERALHAPNSGERYGQLYAAQQALTWALDPESVATPLKVIDGGLVTPPTGTPEGSGDCSRVPDHSAS
jgi:hypothetical protein